MHVSLLEILRCPFCGTRLSLVDNHALDRRGPLVAAGVLGCECCAFPIVAGIPVLLANDSTRAAIRALETDQPQTALLTLLDLTDDTRRVDAFERLLNQDPMPTYRQALSVLSRDAEGTYFVHRFSDPTYLTAEAVLRGLGQQRARGTGRALDLCGGSGHLARVLEQSRPVWDEPLPGTVLTDIAYWKLWLAARFMATRSAHVCCDANHPLPFTRESFSLVLLSDAFPYIWHKRLLADEMQRLAQPDGVVVMPHLHNALGDNVSAGDTLTPAAYRQLFEPLRPRLFSDQVLLDDLLEHRIVDLTQGLSAEADAECSEPSVTLLASRQTAVFGRFEVREPEEVFGELRVNPLYRVERRRESTVLTLHFPSEEYEHEFRACRRYLPETLTVDRDLTGEIEPEALGEEGRELRGRRVILDVPKGYC